MACAIVVAATVVAPVVVTATIVIAALAATFPVQRDLGRQAFDDRLRPGAMVDHRNLSIGNSVAVDTAIVEIVAILVAVIVEIIAILLRVLDRHLRLRGRDDAIVVLGVLEIVLRHDPVAGAVCITGKGGVFFGDLLSRTADLHVRAIALVVARQGIRSLAVVVVIIVIIATTAAA